MPKAASSALNNCSSGRGTRTLTPSPTPCASPSRHCASASVNPGSSQPWPVSATASTPNQTPVMTEETVDRPPGMSVRLKLTLSYAGFLMLAGALLLAAVAVFLVRYVPLHEFVFAHLDLNPQLGPSRRALLGRFRPDRRHRPGAVAAIRTRGWVAPRRPNARPAHAHHRGHPDRSDWDALPPNPATRGQDEFPRARRQFRRHARAARSTCRRTAAVRGQRLPRTTHPRWRSPQALLEVARTDPSCDTGELVDRLYVVNARAIDLTEAVAPTQPGRPEVVHARTRRPLPPSGRGH